MRAPRRLGRTLPHRDSDGRPGGPVLFDPIRYWRGPVWVLVNWLVADGLRPHRLVRPDGRAGSGPSGPPTRPWLEQGFSEYYDPRTGAGIGGHGFSWSAALTLA